MLSVLELILAAARRSAISLLFSTASPPRPRAARFSVTEHTEAAARGEGEGKGARRSNLWHLQLANYMRARVCVCVHLAGKAYCVIYDILPIDVPYATCTYIFTRLSSLSFYLRHRREITRLRDNDY